MRLLELLVALGLFGYCIYAIYAGEVQGKFRVYSRSDSPGSFWTTVLFTLVIGAVFLLKAVAWRH